MASFNKVILMGNLVKDPDLKTLTNINICEFTLAINSSFTSNGEKKEEVSFIDITVFGKQAENCNQYLTKGSAVIVDGRLQQQRWEDKESGKQRSKIIVIAQGVTFMPKNEKRDNDPGAYHAPQTVKNVPF